ncbi:RING finger protein mug145-like [Diospyros lotus]|uniref:RING finger protein mug145-like n=1 Tax=Diospyros lotus TaxID=55363 RepID=UPI002255C12D|nr:RING finger protein mug145-like [Diospyros lotus]
MTTPAAAAASNQRLAGPSFSSDWHNVYSRRAAGISPQLNTFRNSSERMGAATGPRPTTAAVIVLDDEKKPLTGKKRLRKGIYSPGPKWKWRLRLYYRRDPSNGYGEEEELVGDEEGCNCGAICLEKFEPREEVTVTPCDHLFHEECIMPWLKSNSRCPVCRFSVPL